MISKVQSEKRGQNPIVRDIPLKSSVQSDTLVSQRKLEGERDKTDEGEGQNPVSRQVQSVENSGAIKLSKTCENQLNSAVRHSPRVESENDTDLETKVEKKVQKEALLRSNVKIWDSFLEKAKISQENYVNGGQNPKEKGSGQKKKQKQKNKPNPRK